MTCQKATPTIVFARDLSWGSWLVL